uniref:O-methyltransferase domain-containing protein n=1 Tax=Oryza glumipatula TaxID=40148 RepID=A0A0E0BJW7_9ORYZ
MALVHGSEEVISHEEDMVGAFALLYHHVFSYIKPMALKCAVELGIPDAIHRRGGAATLADIAADTGVHASRLTDLRCLMKLLTTSGMFDAAAAAATDGGEPAATSTVYTLTAASGLVVGPRGLSTVVRFAAGPVAVSPFFDMHAWLRAAPPAARSLFELAHGRSRWDAANADNDTINAHSFVESQLLIEAVLRDHAGVFRGLSSLVDVGGGHGAVAKAIAAAFPDIKCTVMDLPHVVADAPVSDDGNLHLVAGDMEAIPAREAGGKVIITELVLGSPAASRDANVAEAEDMHSLFLMCISGVGREEREWRAIFSDSGFGDYKITPVLGPISVIEVYP